VSTFLPSTFRHLIFTPTPTHCFILLMIKMQWSLSFSRLKNDLFLLFEFLRNCGEYILTIPKIILTIVHYTPSTHTNALMDKDEDITLQSVFIFIFHRRTQKKGSHFAFYMLWRIEKKYILSTEHCLFLISLALNKSHRYHFWIISSSLSNVRNLCLLQDIAIFIGAVLIGKTENRQ
jgi:hypothetical protein